MMVLRDGNKPQLAPFQTDTGLVGDEITEPERMWSSSTYEELMSSPYKVEAPDGFVMKDSEGNYAGFDMTKLNLDGKIYHTWWYSSCTRQL